jgi:hypothetical protein
MSTSTERCSVRTTLDGFVSGAFIIGSVMRTRSLDAFELRKGAMRLCRSFASRLPRPAHSQYSWTRADGREVINLPAVWVLVHDS